MTSLRCSLSSAPPRPGRAARCTRAGAALPESPLLSASMQMLAASLFLGIAGLATGETSGIHADSFSTKPLVAFVYLVVVGSLIAFSDLHLIYEERANLDRLHLRVWSTRSVTVGLGTGALGRGDPAGRR